MVLLRFGSREGHGICKREAGGSGVPWRLLSVIITRPRGRNEAICQSIHASLAPIALTDSRS